jgi:hypothetical protein
VDLGCLAPRPSPPQSAQVTKGTGGSWGLRSDLRDPQELHLEEIPSVGSVDSSPFSTLPSVHVKGRAQSPRHPRLFAYFLPLNLPPHLFEKMLTLRLLFLSHIEIVYSSLLSPPPRFPPSVSERIPSLHASPTR